MQERILLLDDDATVLSILEGVLTGAGYACSACSNPKEALALIHSDSQIAVLVSDVVMPGLSGIELAGQLNAMELDRPRPRVLLLTAQPSVERAVDALRLGVRDFLFKPIQPAALIESVGRAMAQSRQDRLSAAASSPQVRLLMRQAEDLAYRLRTLAYTTDTAFTDMQAPIQPITTPTASTPTAPEVPPSHPQSGPLSVLDTIEHLRRLRSRYEQHKLDDVAWDLLLELLRAERLHQRLSVSGLTISVGNVSVTTSLRRLNELTTRGYIQRHSDPDDARRDFVALTATSHELLADYLARANAYLLDLAPHTSVASNSRD